MVKKFKTTDDDFGAGRFGALGDSQLAAAIKESAQQIWLAGLGAFAKAQEEGQKMFNTLVKQGTTLHQRTRTMTDGKVGDVGGRVNRVASEFQKQASEGWDKLEQVFEDRVARALKRLGVPTNKEIEALSKEVEALTAAVARLSEDKATLRKRSKPSAKKAAKTIAPRTAPRKAAARKTAAE